VSEPSVVLSTAGYKVYSTSRRGAQADQGPFEMLALDVTRDDSVEAAVRELVRLEGRIDLFLLNASSGAHQSIRRISGETPR